MLLSLAGSGSASTPFWGGAASGATSEGGGSSVWCGSSGSLSFAGVAVVAVSASDAVVASGQASALASSL